MWVGYIPADRAHLWHYFDGNVVQCRVLNGRGFTYLSECRGTIGRAESIVCRELLDGKIIRDGTKLRGRRRRLGDKVLNRHAGEDVPRFRRDVCRVRERRNRGAHCWQSLRLLWGHPCPRAIAEVTAIDGGVEGFFLDITWHEVRAFGNHHKGQWVAGEDTRWLVVLWIRWELEQIRWLEGSVLFQRR